MVAKTLLKVNSNTRIFLEIFQHFQNAYLQERLWMDTSENSYGKLRNPGQESHHFQCHFFTYIYQMEQQIFKTIWPNIKPNVKNINSNPLDTGRKLHLQRTFRRLLGRLLKVLRTFYLRFVSRGTTGSFLLFLKKEI